MNAPIPGKVLNPPSAWDRLARPPAAALKKIAGGRLNGMTDINPQWRYKAMTDVFGPVGQGWTYSVERIWTEPGVEGQVFMFAQVAVRICTNGTWSEPVHGVGGTMLLEKQKNYLHHNDEAPKMAVTDALSVALKMFGVAADIYMGRWDGSKYKDAMPGAGAEQEETTQDAVAGATALLEAAAQQGSEAFSLAVDSLPADIRKQIPVATKKALWAKAKGVAQ